MKIFKKAVIGRVKWFGLLFLNLVPLNTQNEINTKNTSESAVIKKFRQLSLLVIEKTNGYVKLNQYAKNFIFLLLVRLNLLWLLLFKLQLNSNWIIYRNKLKFIKLTKLQISIQLDASKNTIIKYKKISI